MLEVWPRQFDSILRSLMIILKSAEEIEKIRASSLIVSQTLAECGKHINPGITTLELDEIAEGFIRSQDAKPGFKGYRGYPNTLCTSVNSVVVHGIPNKKALEEGDIISIDCGVIYNGYYGDSAYTFKVGTVKDETKQLLKITRESLFEGIKTAVSGNRVGDIGYTIQNYCEKAGYSVVRELVGHGIGKHLHEEPEVPNYGRRGSGPKLKNGMVICIEPMINMGKKSILQDADGWTIRTADHQPSAHFELTIAISGNEPMILSTFEYIEKLF